MAYNFTNFLTSLSKSVDHIANDLKKLRTGKATPQLLDSVVVDAYGSAMKINEVATVAAPEATLLVVTPWDKSILENIEKAIASAQLNLNPVVDGDLIRIVVPPLTEERRKEMVKVLHQKVEEGKKMMRSIRQDAKKEIENLEGEDGVSEDDIKINLEELEKIFKKYLDQLDEVTAKKEADLMKVG
jgi:ribosome recycling factor